MKRPIFDFLLRLIPAAILAQTLFFKFSAAPETVYIFETLGVEPWGRLTSGAVEAIAAILLLLPRTAAWGGLLAAGVMAGAIGSHLTILGIVVKDDGGTLFALALVTFVTALITVFRRASQLPILSSVAPAP